MGKPKNNTWAKTELDKDPILTHTQERRFPEVWHSSRFDIRNGSVIRGPAEKQLHNYNCILEEERLLVEL